MTNKEIFALSAECGRKLKTAGQANHVTKAKQIIYDTISPILTNHIDPRKKNNVATLSAITDEEIRARLRIHLIERLNDKTLQAAEIAQLKDVFGLSSATADTTINIVDYANVIIDCPHCGEDVHRPPDDALGV